FADASSPGGMGYVYERSEQWKPFYQFDPALGTLQSVNVNIDARTTPATFTSDNEGSGSANIKAWMKTAFKLMVPGLGDQWPYGWYWEWHTLGSDSDGPPDYAGDDSVTKTATTKGFSFDYSPSIGDYVGTGDKWVGLARKTNNDPAYSNIATRIDNTGVSTVDITITYEFTSIPDPDPDPDPGSDQDNPVMPDNNQPDGDGGWNFGGVDGGGNWFDPPLATGYLYETDGLSNFTDVTLPTGLPDTDNLYTVDDGINPSVAVAGGGSYSFPVPVDSFTITGIDPAVDGGDPLAFPTFLVFDETTVSFTMTPTPEPTTLILLAAGSLAVLRRRRKQ
ncbi:MAG: PEP-CTERM sorting domain-containing protein, partial [Phycisphaerae bacterium]|nr:PEP-CTERM sorting domain-containing protein [Phycisphaerae bacterium]